jgi:sterol desaturase/sphingolipid hydroxylase (fatty acid hydroxylase superfamily)
MTQMLIEHPWIAVIATMLSLLVLEEMLGRGEAADPGSGRIVTNFMLYSLGLGLTGLIGVFIPFWSGATGRAVLPGFDMFAQLHLPWAARLGALFLVDSLLAYWLHRASHHFTPLWRLHSVHHTDRVLDVTTGIRHHPLEILPALAVQLIAIAICGATMAQAVIVSLANIVWALFTHAAVGRSPAQLPRPMRILVSPAFHRLHHSSQPRQTNSNYANTFAVWDWLFKTACDPLHESAGEVGLGPAYAKGQSLDRQLLLPFRRVR